MNQFIKTAKTIKDTFNKPSQDEVSGVQSVHLAVVGFHIYEYNVASVIQVDYVNDPIFKSTHAPFVQLQNVSDLAL
jgi:hypothetical protein